MINVDNSTTTLTFPAPSLPDGVFNDTIAVMVIATTVNGIGIASEPTTEVIIGITCIMHNLCSYVYIM